MNGLPDGSFDDAYIEYLARCDQAFRPFAPIELPQFFAGRIKHIERLQAEIDAPGRQVAIFGERGVGKTSLAKLAYFFLRREEDRTHFVQCHRSSDFDSIFSEILGSAGVDVVLEGMEADSERRGGFAAGPLSLATKRRTRKTFRTVAAGPELGPRLILQQFKDGDGLIVIDEYDRVQDQRTHTRLAETIKQFSDEASKTKIILVGVAETLTQLIGEHESLSRSLAQIRLDRMGDEELRDIIDRGEQHAHAAFKEGVKHRIVRLSDGFPYFVHLLARHACRAAGKVLRTKPSATAVVAEEEYADGLRDALENVEHSLTEKYEEAVVTTRRPSEKYRLVLWAMAISDTTVVQVQDIARNAAFLTGKKDISPAKFSFHLGRLASSDRGDILTKVREGFYKFTNPLMRPYIRFILELQNVLTPGEQLEFPFTKATR